jgi:hypothetical protein
MYRFSIIIIFFAFLSTIQANASDKVDKRTLQPFDKISLRVAGNMQVIQDEKHYIEITANEVAINKIIVEVINHKLIIRFSWDDMLFSNFTPGPIDIKVHTPQIDELSLQGSGSIFSDSELKTPRMVLYVAGSGDIKLAKLNCELFEANISGSGDIIISGDKTTRETKVNIAGSGNLKAYQFETEAAYINIAGSGNCELHVTDYLNARILGSGNLAYLGEPQIELRTSGSGRIYKK